VRERPVSMMAERWLVISRSIHRLYRDLLTLETYAVMAYCSFSKILKKHDKVTGYPTRLAYMTSFVEKANFASYPRLLDLFRRCRRMDEEISGNVLNEVTNNLTEDERLFVRTVQRLSEDATQTTAERGTPPLSETAREEIWKPATFTAGDAGAAAAVTVTPTPGTWSGNEPSAQLNSKRQGPIDDGEEEDHGDRKIPALPRRCGKKVKR